MDPRSYVAAYLERLYLATHPELTDAARALVHDDVPQRPEKYAPTEHAQALVAYADAHGRMMRALERIEDLPDEEFERKRAQTFDEARATMARIAAADQLCIDAALVGTLLADISIDACLGELLKVERRAHEYLVHGIAGFSDDAPHFWDERFCAAHPHPDATAPRAAGNPSRSAHLPDDAKPQNATQRVARAGAAHTARTDAPSIGQADARDGNDATGLARLGARTASTPELVGWLHTLEALAQLCLASARYRAAERYARTVLRAVGYPSHAEGTVFLALARLEDEDGFFSFARDFETSHAHLAGSDMPVSGSTPALEHSSPTDGVAGAPAGRGALDDSPWFLLGRTLLLYKVGRRKPARRALRDFVTRCDGGAFFLLNPTYMTPYLPVRPIPHASWECSHQAVWEADGIIVDTPDFMPWAESVEGVREAAEQFANRNGF